MLISADQSLVDETLSIAAAAAVEPTVLTEPSLLFDRWAGLDTVLVGEDCAAAVASLHLPDGPKIHLVGRDPTILATWSMPLRASIVTLPGGAEALSNVFSQRSSAHTSTVVTVRGASGGVGASTLAVGLAYQAAQQGFTSAVVDVDPLGGGIDLLLGAENVAGWRWDRLSQAQGQMGDLSPILPCVDGLHFLSMPRQSAFAVGCEPVAAVLRSLRQTHRFLATDPGRGREASGEECSRIATVQLLVVSTSVRSIAAAHQTLEKWVGVAPQLVIRRDPGTHATEDIIASQLELPVAGVLPHDPRTSAAAEYGEPPGRAVRHRRGWGHACSHLLGRLV